MLLSKKKDSNQYLFHFDIKMALEEAFMEEWEQDDEEKRRIRIWNLNVYVQKDGREFEWGETGEVHFRFVIRLEITQCVD